MRNIFLPSTRFHPHDQTSCLKPSPVTLFQNQMAYRDYAVISQTDGQEQPSIRFKRRFLRPNFIRNYSFKNETELTIFKHGVCFNRRISFISKNEEAKKWTNRLHTHKIQNNLRQRFVFYLAKKISQLNSNKSFFFGLDFLRKHEVISVIIIAVGKVVKLNIFSFVVLSSGLLR